MCTVVLLYRLYPDCPVVVAGNRDEWFARAASSPHVWTIREGYKSVRLFAGRDLTAGGTWLGVNQHGLLAGVTNLYTGSRNPDKASRGQLVLRCLLECSPDRALALLTPSEASRYNPFNLFLVSEDGGYVITSNPPELRTLRLGPGAHILTNHAPDDPRDEKRIWLASRLADLPQDPRALTEYLGRLLASHGQEGPGQPVCLHLPGYGTVASYQVFLDRRKRRIRYLYSPGAPCTTPYQDLTPSFLALFAPEAPPA